MDNEQVVYPQEIDILNCEKEPIHLIGKSQAHGIILACNPGNFQITQCGTNAEEFFGIDYKEVLNKNLEDFIGENPLKKLKNELQGGRHLLPEEFEINGRQLLMLPHLAGENLILDFEESDESRDSLFFQRQLIQILKNLNASGNISKLCADAARLTKDIFGYDRVMVYKFDEEWNGEVVAEEKEDSLESWLGLHYPASDIPAQSRELFLKHRVRIIADVNYTPIPIHPEISPINGQPLDLSKSQLRGVSPIHIEYLKNMKVGASLTAAIIANGKLWGLIACHHYSAKFINYFQRETCEFLSQVFSNQLALKLAEEFKQESEINSGIQARLLKQIQEEGEIFKGLTNAEIKFTELVAAKGGAILLDGDLKLSGITPGEEEVKQLISEFLREKEEEVFFTKNLGEEYPEAKNYTKEASGILSYRLGRNKNHYLIWFRPEEPQSVSWGGNPENKITYNEKEGRLGPRKSFEKWTQNLSGIAQGWKNTEIKAARELGENLNYLIVERQKEEISQLNDKLMKAVEELELFSYSISHDLRGPLRGVDGFARILKEDHFEELSKEGQEVVETILLSAKKMDDLIDDILCLSKISTGNIIREKIEVELMIRELLESLNLKVNYPNTGVEIEKDLPPMNADKTMVYQVWSNLIGNALKYSARGEKPEVQIGSFKHNGKTGYFVKDNGIGLDVQKEEQVFKAFKRVAGTDYSGSGIGLAVVKRIIDKHQGRIWFESEKDKGTVFKFYI
ncbi:ATP-binding protein [Salegentibacter sediminis]|uniref:ATP-binding protein n=1 Tax=Salegentibacter sediminis TaxID=1930251 RepID=UPI0009BFE12D|nr:ATP-binding protein [Salegentibacter sediminis]